MVNDKTVSVPDVGREEWANAKCDKYDYLIAVFCGGIAGLIDVFFVGDPLSSVLGGSVDKAADKLVMKAAQFFWKGDGRAAGKPRAMPDSLEKSISYLEQAFPVNYDARYAKDLILPNGGLEGMRAANHHLLSLAHSPDPIGLIFSIINQYMGYATFVDKGHLIHAIPAHVSGAIPYLQGSTFPSMLFCGFVNWIGHLISDLAGSSSTRAPGKVGRGAGLPIPFYELFQACDFGDIDGNSFADTMIKVFEQGYDLRFGAAMAIPVVLEELMIRVIWTVRQKFIRKKPWSESLPTSAHADLRIMLIVGAATLCAVDGLDAAAHGLAGGGNIISFICHLNLIGWARLVMLILKELYIRYGHVIMDVLQRFSNWVLDIATPEEKRLIQELHRRLTEYDNMLQAEFAAFVQQIEVEYRELLAAIQATFDEDRTPEERGESSVDLAKLSNVPKEKIITNLEQLDEMFS